MPNFAQTLAKLPPRSRMVLAGGAVAVLVVAFLLFRLASSPSYTTLASGLQPAQTGKVTAALDEKGLQYELQANGTAVAVPKASLGQARIALAEGGVSTGSGSGDKAGYELFDKVKLGASDTQLQVTKQRALEGEIARTIEGVQGVNSAQVRLVLPEQELFSEEETPATAAVLLDATELEPAAVRGIAQLTASSVRNLKLDNVTITDASGQMLWPTGDGTAAGGGAGGRMAAEQRYERTLEGSLMAMLTRTLGPDKAQVSVNAALNLDDVKRDTLTYAKKGVPLETQTETERLRGNGSAAGGRAGTAGNVPGYAQSAAGGGSSNYQRKTNNTKYGVDKVVERTIGTPGQVQKLDIALVVDQSVPAPVVNQLKAAVSSAAGLDLKRGDTISVANVKFAPAPKAQAPGAGPVPAGLAGPLKWAGLGLGVILFLFFMFRHLRKREAEALADPAWLSELTMPVPLAELEETVAHTPHSDLPERQLDPEMFKLGRLMEREPDRVAAHVRQLMSED